MSDNWILLIPEDPSYIPDATRHARALERFSEIAPKAEQIKAIVTDAIQFFDCGGNFERQLCPSCRAEIPIEWWQERMDEEYGQGFRPARHCMPCCSAQHTLHDLVYEWPQGFGRFALEAMNPSIGKLEDKYKRELEDILGTELRVIYQHI